MICSAIIIRRRLCVSRFSGFGHSVYSKRRICARLHRAGAAAPAHSSPCIRASSHARAWAAAIPATCTVTLVSVIGTPAPAMLSRANAAALHPCMFRQAAAARARFLQSAGLRRFAHRLPIKQARFQTVLATASRLTVACFFATVWAMARLCCPHPRLWFGLRRYAAARGCLCPARLPHAQRKGCTPRHCGIESPARLTAVVPPPAICHPSPTVYNNKEARQGKR